MTDFGRKTGLGDMLKSVYDTDNSGVVDAVPVHKTSHQDAGSDEINASGLAGRTNYVDRGDPAAADFAQGDLTTDGTWQDLDLSGIVPEGAVCVVLQVLIYDDHPGSYIRFRKKGNTNTQNAYGIRIQLALMYTESNGLVSCDANRVIQYMASDITWDQIRIVVKGWFI